MYLVVLNLSPLREFFSPQCLFWFLQVQGKDPSVDITQEVVEESEDERYDEMPDSGPPIELPPVELGRLEEIKRVS